MGLGIAYVAANVSRLPVVLMDINKEQTDNGIKFMSKKTGYPTMHSHFHLFANWMDRQIAGEGCRKAKDYCRACSDHT